MDQRGLGLPHVLRMLIGLFVVSVTTGVLGAGVALPATYLAGSAVSGGVDLFQNMPGDFAISSPAQQSRILDASGALIANPYDENRIIVPLEKISPWMQKAQVAIEDSRFFEHGGLDVRGFTRALVSTLRGAQVQGGSTLTQQFVKVTLQENAVRAGDKEAADAAVAKTPQRKLQELRYALTVEQNYTKKQILAGYLNLVNYGDNAYGVEAAAQNYFGIPASKLSISQAALLAGIVQQPTANNPVVNPKAALARRNVVIDRMAQLGLVTPAQAAEAKKPQIKDMLKVRKLGGTCKRSPEPYFCDYVLQWIAKAPEMAVLGKTKEERMKHLKQDGLTVRTTLNPTTQKAALKLLRDAVPANNSSNLGGAATIIEPGTGHIIAMVQWSDYAKVQTNYNVDREYGGGEYGYQFGSTAKTYALVTALEKGMRYTDDINAPQAGVSNPYIFKNSDMHDECAGDVAGWPVRNDYSIGGRMSLAKATAQSINTAFAALTIRLGGCEVRDVMTRMGMHDGSGRPIGAVLDPSGKIVGYSISAIALGAGTVTPMTIAASYATLAAKGKYCKPMPLVSITNFNNKPIAFQTSSCEQVIDEKVAANVTKLLEGPLRNGTAADSGWSMSRPAAGKTGTTNNHNQAWFVGYTPQLSTAVWTGNVKPSKPNGDLLSLNGKCFGVYGCPGSVFGGTVSAKVWAKMMRAASEGMPVMQFPEPSNERLGNCIQLPNVFGQSPASAAAELEAAGFPTYRAGTTFSNAPVGSVADTDPSDCAVKGVGVGLVISGGRAPVKPKPAGTTPAPGATTAAPGGPPPVTLKPKPTKKKP